MKGPDMKKLMMATLMVAAGLSVGCSQNKKEVAQVPPPPEMEETMSFEPVEVESEATIQQASFDEPMAAESTHTIRKGDTLYSIARRHYGDGKQWQAIVAANPGLDPQKLPVGKTIVLP